MAVVCDNCGQREAKRRWAQRKLQKLKLDDTDGNIMAADSRTCFESHLLPGVKGARMAKCQKPIVELLEDSQWT